MPRASLSVSFRCLILLAKIRSRVCCTTVTNTDIPRITNLTTLDLSKNALQTLNPKICLLVSLKSLNLEQNQLPSGSLVSIAKLSKLQTLSVGGNRLGRHAASETTRREASTSEAFPANLPSGLKQLKVDSNFLSSVPRPILSVTLTKLEKLDLSSNHLATIPTDISNLVALVELNMDNNVIVSLPDEIGTLKKLKGLSLRGNCISVDSTNWSSKNPQPLPKSLFADTPLIDLNLHGNPMTSTQLNSMEGYDTFLERRQKVKTSTLLGGGLTNMDVCGLE
jgi:Leucine-rich repeat (LRR) protein